MPMKIEIRSDSVLISGYVNATENYIKSDYLGEGTDVADKDGKSGPEKLLARTATG